MSGGFEIVIGGPERLSHSSSGEPIFDIHCVVDGQAYPEPAWSDFGCVLLMWWIAAVGQLWQGKRVARLPFMEGPFEVRIQRRAAGRVEVSLRGSNQLRQATLVGVSEALLSAAEAVKVLLRGDTRDHHRVDALADQVTLLRKLNDPQRPQGDRVRPR